MEQVGDVVVGDVVVDLTNYHLFGIYIYSSYVRRVCPYLIFYTHTPTHPVIDMAEIIPNFLELGAAAQLHANPESVSKFLTFSFSLSFSICGKNGKKKNGKLCESNSEFEGL